MWVLETEGDALQGKKLWLRPGKKFIFGRTKAEDGQFVISNKTISRQHLTVEVGAAGSAECCKPQARSMLILTDCDTKIGTLVNGEQIRGKSHVVKSGRNVVTLGRYEYHFTFTWVPVNLTFSFTSKEVRADPYTALYEQLGPLDIKVLMEYKRDITTHLVAKKRNTSKGLQALIDGKYIVHNDSYIKALVTAATPSEDGSNPRSPLEEDWEENFPDPLQYLPPRGEEPTQRDAIAYSPNPIRQDMFEGYTFVFYEKKQFENLLAPITDGRGKGILREVIPDETTVDEFVRFVKSVAGEKGLGKFEDGSEGKGVVVVRFNPVKGVGSEWFADFNREVALCLDHRLIEQNEFLDAILGNDASVLRRPLEFVQSGAVAPAPTGATVMSSQTLRSSPAPQAPQAPDPTPTEMAPPVEPPRRGRSRRTATTRFKPFDDDFNGPSGLITVPESMVVDSAPAVESQSQGLFVSQDPEPRTDREASQPLEMQRGSRKRSTPPVQYDDDDDDNDDFLADIAPRVAAFKKRKIIDDAARGQRGESTPPAPTAKEKLATTNVKTKGVKKELDVAEFLNQQQEKTAALARAEREQMHEAMNAEDIEAMGKLTTIVGEMQLRRSEPRRSAAQADESDRWDERWNGRKNFKKFRRRGVDGPGPNFNRIIVPLQEVKKKDFGIGDEYWLEEEHDNQRKKKKGKGKETQDVSQPQSQARPKGRRAAEILVSDAEEDPLQEVVPSSDVEIVEKTPEPPRKVVARSKTLVDKTNESQSLPAAGNNRKRAAATTLTKPAPAKKAREAKVEDSDDSDDGLKFRFARKR